MSKDKQPPQTPPEDDDFVNPAEHVLSGGIRGEVYGCPSGLSMPSRAPKREDDKETGEEKKPGAEPRQE